MSSFYVLCATKETNLIRNFVFAGSRFLRIVPPCHSFYELARDVGDTCVYYSGILDDYPGRWVVWLGFDI
jgi:hypothetical protein